MREARGKDRIWLAARFCRRSARARKETFRGACLSGRLATRYWPARRGLDPRTILKAEIARSIAGTDTGQDPGGFSSSGRSGQYQAKSVRRASEIPYRRRGVPKPLWPVMTRGNSRPGSRTARAEKEPFLQPPRLPIFYEERLGRRSTTKLRQDGAESSLGRCPKWGGDTRRHYLPLAIGRRNRRTTKTLVSISVGINVLPGDRHS